jgi:biopolymer transport protein ExbD
MAEIIANEGGGKQKGKKRSKRHSTHIDMTPMVDLMCLLLTFFMLTTAFSKAKVMEIVLPEKPKSTDPKPPEVDKDRALNIILIGGDKVLWYKGLADPKDLPLLTETDFSSEGIRNVVLHRNKDLFVQIETMNKKLVEGTIKLPKDTVTARRKKMMMYDKTGPVILIKAADDVKYHNIVDIIDEMAICDVARYALVDINVVEKKMVADFLAGKASGAASVK